MKHKTQTTYHKQKGCTKHGLDHDVGLQAGCEGLGYHVYLGSAQQLDLAERLFRWKCPHGTDQPQRADHGGVKAEITKAPAHVHHPDAVPGGGKECMCMWSVSNSETTSSYDLFMATVSAE